MVNTILAYGARTNAAINHLVDDGSNISSDGSPKFTSASSVNNTDPLLGPPSDNGGPIETMCLLPGSPAIDRGNNDFAPPTDQRGFARYGISDIGACEFIPPRIFDVSLEGGHFQFNVTADVGPKYYVEYLTDLAVGSWIASAENPYFATNHVFQFKEVGLASNSNRFFRIRAQR